MLTPNIHDYQVRRIFSEGEAEKIRELTENADVFRENYPGYEKWIKMALDEVVKGRRVAFGAFRLIWDEQFKPAVKLIGSIIVNEEKYGSGVELKNLYVAEEYRRHLCGTALEFALEKHYAKKRYRLIKTEVPATEKGTISFLLNRGYRVLLTKKSPHKEGQYVTEMQKELPPKYGGDYYDRADFLEWVLQNIYNLSETSNEGSCLKFYLKPKLASNEATRATGVLFINNEQTTVTKDIVKDLLSMHPNPHLKMIFGRTFTPEAMTECVNQGVLVFDDKSILSQFGNFFAYPPPKFIFEDIGGMVVVVNGDYLDRMKSVEPGTGFTYFKGGKFGRYLKKENQVLFYFTKSQKCPESAILAYSEVLNVHAETPDKIWDEYKNRNPLFNEQEYRTFVANKQTILAIECTDLKWIKPISDIQLCGIVNEPHLDVDDIGHLYLSKQMLLDFEENLTLIEELGRNPDDNTIAEFKPKFGIITALPIECAALGCFLINPKRITRNDGYYIKGEIGSSNGEKHQVVVALVDVGTTLAAARTSALLERFPSIESVIMVGIAGGIPNVSSPNEHVRLGDIVVSNEGGFIQYDFVKEEPYEIIARHPPRPPGPKLLQAVKLLQAEALQGKRPWEEHIIYGMDCICPKVERPEETTDILIASDGTERKLEHPVDPQRIEGQPRVFLGPIASSNTLLKNRKKRDLLRDRFGVKAVEMEASGVADACWDKGVGVLVIRGICDYCDSTKNDLWHHYSAIVAAAYTRTLIESMPT